MDSHWHTCRRQFFHVIPVALSEKGEGRLDIGGVSSRERGSVGECVSVLRIENRKWVRIVMVYGTGVSNTTII